MLVPDYNLRAITVKRRETSRWFKRGTSYRKAADVLRTATEPMTATDLGPYWPLARGTFPATFFLACIPALELDGVALVEI